MPWYIIFHIENEYQTCFGVTSPFRGLAGNLGYRRPVCDRNRLGRIDRRNRKRPEQPANGWDKVFSYKNVIGPCFGVTGPFREVGGQSGPTAGRRPAVRQNCPPGTGKGLSGLEMAGITFFHIENEYQTCFGVTTPFPEVGGQSVWPRR